MLRVSAEYLIRTIATYGHGHQLARSLAKHVGWEGTAVGEGLVGRCQQPRVILRQFLPRQFDEAAAAVAWERTLSFLTAE